MMPAERAQEHGALGRVEVADRAAEEGEQPLLAGRDPLEVAAEVAHHAVHLESRGSISVSSIGAGVHDRLVDVEGDVALEAALAGHRVEQRPRLRRHPRAQLDQLRGARAPTIVGRMAVEDLALAARRVVLRQRGDPVEQHGAALVVEELGRQLLQRAREAVAHVVGHRCRHRRWLLDDDAHQPSSAQRKPAKIWRRCG